MRKGIMFLLILVGISAGLGLRFTTSLAQTAGQPAPGAIEEQAGRIYNNLYILPIRDRKELFSGLTPELKSELWKVQFRSYLLKHPDLTDDQRQAIEAAIVHFTPQLYKIPEGSADWEEKVHKPTQLVTKRIFAVFPPEVAKELVTVLGGSDSPQSFNFGRINSFRGVIISSCAKSSRQNAILRLIKKPTETQTQAVAIIPASYSQEDCYCSTRSPSDCPAGLECLVDDCRQVLFCGDYYLYTCNGSCFYFPCYC